MISNAKRQRLLENKTLNLEGVVTQTRTLEIAQKNSEVYHSTEYRPTGAVVILPNDDTLHESADNKCSDFGQRPRNSQECYFCCNSRHPRYACPAKDATCHRCQKGHFAKFCQSPPSTQSPNVAAAMPKLASITCMTPSRPITASVPNCLNQAQLPIYKQCPASRSSWLWHFWKFYRLLVLHCQSSPGRKKTTKFGLAAGLIEAETHGQVTVALQSNEEYCENMHFKTLKDLCVQAILGQEFMKLHSEVKIIFRGQRNPLNVCALSVSTLPPPLLFNRHSGNCRPIATKSRKFLKPDNEFISNEVERMFKAGIIIPSNSPWRA